MSMFDRFKKSDDASQQKQNQQEPNVTADDKSNQQQNQQQSQLIDPWTKDIPANQQQSNTQQAQQQAVPATIDPKKQMQEFMETNGLYKDLDMGGFVESVRNGDIEKSTAFLSQALQNSVMTALNAASKIADAKVEKAMKKVSTDSTSESRTQFAVEQMYSTEALKFAKEPSIAPIAEGALKNFLEKGQSVSEAIKSVEKYFEQTLSLAGKQFGYVKHDTQRRSGFNNARTIDDADDNASNDDNDFVAILTGQK